MSTYSHLKFYDNAQRNNVALGIPTLNATTETTRSSTLIKSSTEKHADLIEYLKGLQRETRATYIDIKRVLNIDLDYDEPVLSMMKNNPKVDMEPTPDGKWSMQYRAKYEIRNKEELLHMINRVRNGILMSDIKDCYTRIEEHVSEMVISGEIIEYKNSEKKCGVLYPRMRPFLTPIQGGYVTATPGKQMVTTSTDLRADVRRGDVIRVGSTWYRVSAATGVGDERWNKLSSSVSSDQDLSSTRGFLDEFSATQLPLDADYQGSEVYTGILYKHGCTNDIRKQWQLTGVEIRKNNMSEETLLQQLRENNLISRSDATMSTLVQGRKQFSKEVIKKARKKSTRTSRNGVTHNIHMSGTELERIINEAYEQSLREEND